MLGKTMIQRVYEQCLKASSLHTVVVATDDERIAEAVRIFGGMVCLTRADHASGTDRCMDALAQQKEHFDFVINIQGDEPFVDPGQIDLLAKALTPDTELATLIQRITTLEQLQSPGEAKVVLNTKSEAIYFSRSPIPFVQKIPVSDWLQHATFYRHMGLYAYRRDVLGKITQLPQSALEKAESLEQLRWIENGFRIQTVETDAEDAICIDTPDDLQRALDFLRTRGESK